MKTGVQLIAEERKRQIEKEGWSSEHDSDHSLMQLSAAAACYISNAISKWTWENTHIDWPDNTRFQYATWSDNSDRRIWRDAWPWGKEWDKREKHDVLRSLQIAGALIAAEIDRLQNKNRRK